MIAIAMNIVHLIFIAVVMIAWQRSMRDMTIESRRFAAILI